jgi:hypothetical protein
MTAIFDDFLETCPKPIAATIFEESLNLDLMTFDNLSRFEFWK